MQAKAVHKSILRERCQIHIYTYIYIYIYLGDGFGCFYFQPLLGDDWTLWLIFFKWVAYTNQCILSFAVLRGGFPGLNRAWSSQILGSRRGEIPVAVRFSGLQGLTNRVLKGLARIKAKHRGPLNARALTKQNADGLIQQALQFILAASITAWRYSPQSSQRQNTDWNTLGEPT